MDTPLSKECPRSSKKSCIQVSLKLCWIRTWMMERAGQAANKSKAFSHLEPQILQKLSPVIRAGNSFEHVVSGEFIAKRPYCFFVFFPSNVSLG